jgi:hypothetical protein
MNVRRPLRAFALASALALTILSLPGPAAHAGPILDQRKKECIAGGHQWSDTWGCNDKYCSEWNGKYRGGETVTTKDDSYMCDGFTGNWIKVGGRPVPPPGPAGGILAPSGASTP